MTNLSIDWNQERPNSFELSNLWNEIKLTQVHDLSDSGKKLIKTIFETHCNGGIQIHKYKLIGNKKFNWFASRNYLQEIAFIENVVRHKHLENYRSNLEIIDSKPKVKVINYSTDIYELLWRLARIMGYGGAYERLDPNTA